MIFKTLFISIIIFCASFITWIFYQQYTQNSGITDIKIHPLHFQKTEQLFTSFAYIPLIDYQYGYLKRDIISKIQDKKENKVILGYCFRQYEVGIGYQQLPEIFKKYQNAVCSGKPKQLPQPMILSSNAVSSKAMGKYTRKNCDTWDLEKTKRRKSHSYLKRQLVKDQHWNRIISNSQKILISILRLHCSTQNIQTR
jgi:hypothetical protein